MANLESRVTQPNEEVEELSTELEATLAKPFLDVTAIHAQIMCMPIRRTAPIDALKVANTSPS